KKMEITSDTIINECECNRIIENIIYIKKNYVEMMKIKDMMKLNNNNMSMKILDIYHNYKYKNKIIDYNSKNIKKIMDYLGCTKENFYDYIFNYVVYHFSYY